MPKFLILDGHPEPDGLTASLARSYEEAAGQGAEVERIELRSLRFDLVLRRRHAAEPLEPDLTRAMAAIARAEHVVWVFPTWWGGPPALVKGFCDRVLLPGFAYRYRGRHEMPERLLRGRSARLIGAMDSPGFWYHLVQRRPLHSAFLQNTLAFVGFAPIRATLFHEVRFMDEAARAAARARVAEDAARDLRRFRPPAAWSFRRFRALPAAGSE